MLQIDFSTLETVERIARNLDCSVEDIVRDAVSEFAANQVDKVPNRAPMVPESELAATISMPTFSRPVTIRIANRSTLLPAPILPDFDEAT